VDGSGSGSIYSVELVESYNLAQKLNIRVSWIVG
jgi:hypothetical protein